MKRGKLLKTTFVTLMVCATAGTLFACGGDPVTYKVVYTGGEGAVGEAPAEASYEKGATFKLAENTFTKEGYTFNGWNDGTSTYGAGFEYTMGEADVTFTAQWEKNTTPVVEKFTVTYALGDHAASDATAPAAANVEKNTQVTLPAAPAAAEGYEFAGWKVGSDAALKQAGDKITVTADVTVTAQWKEVEAPADDYRTETNLQEKVLQWWTAGTLGYYVGDGEELEVISTMTAKTAAVYTGYAIDIALNNDFYRFRPDAYVWTNNKLNSNANLEALHLEIDRTNWDEAKYLALYADEAPVIQVAKISLKDNIVTVTVTSYAGTDTELATPIVSAIYKVTSQTDISEIQPFFYKDGGAVVTAASATVPKASNTFVDLTFNFDTEGVDNAVVPMRPGKANYVFGVDPVKAGYTFGGWKSSDEADTKLYKNTDEVAVTEAVTYTAQWTQDEYAITYALGENAATTATAPEGVTGKHYGDKITLPAAPAAAENYEFAGWKVGDATELKAAEAEIEVTGTVTITAQFNKKAQYTATFAVGEHAAEGATVADIVVNYDDAEITLPAAPAAATGYEFTGWKVGDDTELKDAGATVTLTANAVYTAQWKAIRYTVTFDLGEHAKEGATVDAMSGDYNTAITLPTVEGAEGYTLSGWKVGTTDTVVNAGEQLNLTANVTLTAQWVSTESSWTVTFLANEEDTAPLSTAVVAKDATGEAKKLPLPTTNPVKSGYKFLGWYLLSDADKTVLTEATLPDVEANTTVVAKWQKIYTVTVLDDLDGEAVEGAKTEYNAETTEKLTLPANLTKDKYNFLGWFTVVDNEGEKAYGDEVTAATDVTANMTIAAKWEKVKYTVTYALGENAATGAEVPDAVEADVDSEITLPAAPAAATDYAFAGWKVGDDAELKAAGAKVTVTGNVTVTAQFTLSIVIGTPDNELAYTPNPEWTGKVKKGETVTLKGTMTSKAEGNWNTVLMFIYGDSVWGNFRMDWYANYADWAKDGSDNQLNESDIASEDWHATKSIGPNWDTFLGSIANCDITITFDWSSPRSIRVTATVVSKAEGNATNTMSYVIAPKSGAFAKEEYNIGLGGDHAYTVITEKSVAERNDNPTVENPVVVAAPSGYTPVVWTTEINKGEKIVFSGTSTSTANSTNWDSTLVSLFSGSVEKLVMRSDNFIVGSDNADNLTAEGFASITPTHHGVVGADDTLTEDWTVMNALKENGNLVVSVDWTGENIIVDIDYSGTVNDEAKTYKQRYTIVLTDGNTNNTYAVALGGSLSTYTVTSIVRTPAGN